MDFLAFGDRVFSQDKMDLVFVGVYFHHFCLFHGNLYPKFRRVYLWFASYTRFMKGKSGFGLIEFLQKVLCFAGFSLFDLYFENRRATDVTNMRVAIMVEGEISGMVRPAVTSMSSLSMASVPVS